MRLNVSIIIVLAEEKDPRIWRYTFDGEKMYVQDGRFVFD